MMPSGGGEALESTQQINPPLSSAQTPSLPPPPHPPPLPEQHDQNKHTSSAHPTPAWAFSLGIVDPELQLLLLDPGVELGKGVQGAGLGEGVDNVL